jgi:hypothetical protein
MKMVVRYPADPAIVAYVINASEGEVVQEAYQTTLFGMTTTCVLLTDGCTIHHTHGLDETRYYDAKGRLTCTVEY